MKASGLRTSRWSHRPDPSCRSLHPHPLMQGRSSHDSHCLAEEAVLTGVDVGRWLGDKGYVDTKNDHTNQEPPIAIFWVGRRNSTPRLTRSD